MNKIDYIAAGLVILCIAMRFQYQWVWFAYALGCYTYVYLGFKKKMLGLAVLNIVGGSIALWNGVTF